MIVTMAIPIKKLWWTNLAAWTFGLFRLVQTWCTSQEQRTTQEFQSPCRLVAVWKSLAVGVQVRILITFPQLACVTSSQWSTWPGDIIIFFMMKILLFHIPKMCAVARETRKQRYVHTCDVCLFSPDRLIDAVTTALMQVLPLSKKNKKNANLRSYFDPLAPS